MNAPSLSPATAGRRALALLLVAAMAACGGGNPQPAEGPPPVVNQAPRADAGVAQSVLVGAQVMLDGRASSDANGDPLTYLWTLSTRPPGSAAALSAATAAAPSFTADTAGAYVATLVVGDGRLDSAAATITVTAAAANAAPVAEAGPAQNVPTGTHVTLDGSASSDANGDALRYLWTLVEKPAASAAQLSEREAARPIFTADTAGRYVASLVVSDGQAGSAASTVTVTASTARLSATASPALADFGTVPIGSSSARIFSVRNTGNGTLTFRAGHPQTDGGPWSVTGRSCSGALAAGASCTITVSFTPNSAQRTTGTLDFGFNELQRGQGQPVAGLAGVGDGDTSLSAVVTPAQADFGTVPIGMTASRVFTVVNTGTDTLTLRPGAPATDGAPWSIGARSCAGALPAGARCTVTVDFRPNHAQAYHGAVTVYFNELPVGQGNPLASVSGVGEGEAALGASLSPAHWDFGIVPIGMSSSRVFTVTNTGNGPLTFKDGQPATDGGVWSLGGRSCLRVLAAGASCTVTVTFTPIDARAYTGHVHVAFDELPSGPGSPQGSVAGSGS